MKPSICALLSVSTIAVLASACAVPTQDGASETTSEAYSTSLWQKVITCNGGAAVLDVDTRERRTVQLVIRDPNAVNYLTGTIGMRMGPLDRGNGRELIVSGWSNNGVFSPSDFRSLTSKRADMSSEAIVSREGRGMKVVFRLNDGSNGGRECVQWRSDPNGGQYCEQWTVRSGSSGTELANWYFDDCR